MAMYKQLINFLSLLLNKVSEFDLNERGERVEIERLRKLSLPSNHFS